MTENFHKKEIFITKASGEKEPFSQNKLHRSLERVGTPPETIEKIVTHITQELKEGMSTRDIYKHAFSLLKKTERTVAGKYSLKQAIMELGPDGHPFEKLIGELLRSQGFSIQVGTIVQGYCVTHEVDVIAEKANQHIMVECKFHNHQGIKSDVKVALYIKARFADVSKAWRQNPEHLKKFHEAWLVTNTKLTTDAIQYAQCANMKAIGWNYPLNNGLEMLIDKSGLHPVTCLTTLSLSRKRQILDIGIILCKDLIQNRRILQSLGINSKETDQIEQEISELCGL